MAPGPRGRGRGIREQFFWGEDDGREGGEDQRVAHCCWEDVVLGREDGAGGFRGQEDAGENC